MIVIPIIAFFILLFGYFFYKHYSQKIARKLAMNKLEENRDLWSSILLKETRVFKSLSKDDQQKLLDSILIFYGEKAWHESLSENDKLITAYYACLPIFKRKTNYYPNIKKINEVWPFKKWLAMNERQFEIDFGKMALKDMKGNFADYSLLLFEDSKNLKEISPKAYQDLIKFYQVEL